MPSPRRGPFPSVAQNTLIRQALPRTPRSTRVLSRRLFWRITAMSLAAQMIRSISGAFCIARSPGISRPPCPLRPCKVFPPCARLCFPENPPVSSGEWRRTRPRPRLVQIRPHPQGPRVSGHTHRATPPCAEMTGSARRKSA